MCGILDDALPVIGSIGGFMIGGPWGAAAGGALGGALNAGIQSHWNPTATLEGAGMGGVGGYFGGGSLASGLSSLGSAGVGATSAGFDTGLAAATPATTGALESATGGGAMYGLGAGTGTALGSASSALGGSGLGIAGGDALSGVSSTGGSFLGALGGGTQGTGLGTQAGSGAAGSMAQSTADLSSATTANAPASMSSPMAASTSATPTGSAVGTLGNTSPTATGITGAGSGETGVPSMEGAQGASAMGGAPGGGDLNSAMASGALNGGGGSTGGGGLSTMFGPDSASVGSPVGQGISNAAAGAQAGVQNGALGEGSNMGMDLSSLFGGGSGGGGQPATDIPGQSIGTNYDAVANSGAQGGNWMNTLNNFLTNNSGALQGGMKLANTGLNAYQQYARQQAANNYANQISQIYSPTGAYAQQMQSNIARQYAAQGRNAEVGPQQVQLAAMLAQSQAQALGGAQYSQAAQNTAGANMLNGLFSNFSSPGSLQQLGQFGGAAYNGLSNLF